VHYTNNKFNVSLSQHSFVLFKYSKELHFPTISTYLQGSSIVTAKKYPNVQVYTTLGSRVCNITSLATAKINKVKNYINFYTCPNLINECNAEGFLFQISP